mmetsp:Transcript_53658/g.85345  ORF Transcript_53658/g.85345 Transcript_53658/m.85345 type:complete len:434 (+) Transcript_53658:84-1385(+)
MQVALEPSIGDFSQGVFTVPSLPVPNYIDSITSLDIGAVQQAQCQSSGPYQSITNHRMVRNCNMNQSTHCQWTNLSPVVSAQIACDDISELSFDSLSLEVAQAAHLGFSLGEKVQWTDSFCDVPPGSTGQVVGFHGDRVRVKFPLYTGNFLASQLVKAYSRGDRVQMRDNGALDWNDGVVTSTHPLQVRFASDPDAEKGYAWVQVQPLQVLSGCPSDDRNTCKHGERAPVAPRVRSISEAISYQRVSSEAIATWESTRIGSDGLTCSGLVHYQLRDHAIVSSIVNYKTPSSSPCSCQTDSSRCLDFGLNPVVDPPQSESEHSEDETAEFETALVTITRLSGQQLEYSLDPSSTFLDVKNRLAAKWKTVASRIELCANGEVFPDDARVLRAGTCFDAVIRASGYGKLLNRTIKKTPSCRPTEGVRQKHTLHGYR